MRFLGPIWFITTLLGCDTDLRVQAVPGGCEGLGCVDDESAADDGADGGKGQQTAPKLSIDGCVDPDLSKVPSDVSLTLCDGSVAHGQLDLSLLTPENVRTGVVIGRIQGAAALESHGACMADGDAGCVVDGVTHKAMAVAAVQPQNVRAGVTIAGIMGTYSPACTADGGSDCHVDGAIYKAAQLAGFTAADVKSGLTIAGVVGSATLESHGACASDGDLNCVTNASYKAADMTKAVAGNIKSGVTIAGVTGGYPSASHPLTGADTTADLDLVTFTSKIKSTAAFEWFDSAGGRHSRSGDSDILTGFIAPGVDIFGTTGSYDGYPSQLASFAVTRNGTTANLTWGAGLNGIVIVRRFNSAVTWTPTNGVAYSSGSPDMNHTIVYVGNGSSYSDIGLSSSGTYHYTAFAYNADRGYSVGKQVATNMQGYRYYRFYINSVAGYDTYTIAGVSKLQFRIGGVWQNQSFSSATGTIGSYAVTVSASSFYDGDWLPHKAFSPASDPDMWFSASGTTSSSAPYNATTAIWLQADFGTGNFVAVDGLRVLGQSLQPERSPDGFELQGSNDSTNWTTIPGSAKSGVNTSSEYEYTF